MSNPFRSLPSDLPPLNKRGPRGDSPWSPAGAASRSPGRGVPGGKPRIAVLLLFLLAAPAFAQGIRVTIDRPEATVRDQLVLAVTIEGSQSARPQLPDLSPFQVVPRGQQSQFNMVNGRTTVSITYNYLLVPKRTGTFTIGPAAVEIDGKTYQSRPFSVRILEASATPSESETLFITASVSDKSPYVGEQVIYTWRFYRRVRAENAQLLTPFEFDGFLVEDLGDVREYTTTRGGQEFLVSEIRKALFPQEEGRLTLPATRLSCQVLVRSRGRRGSLLDEFFGGARAEERVLTSRPIEVEVRPRPAAPRGFSGLVGEFEISSRISKRELSVGESATWRLTVSGKGNAQMIGEPALPELAAFKVYDDKPESSVERSGAELRGSRSFVKALVPLEEGELTVPAVTLTYFDPEAGTYRTASTAPIALAVRPSEGKEELRLTESVAPTTGKVAVRILADDILPIYKGLDAVAAAPFGHRAGPAWLAGVLAPPLVFFGLLLALRRRRHLETNVELVRRRAALRTATKALGGVEKAAKQGESREAARLASRVLREYVGDKVALEGSALTPAEAATQLERRGVDAELVAATRERLEALEAAQYGAGTVEGQDLAAELKALLKRLERQVR